MDWMKTARANARAMDQTMRQNPYKERLRRAGEYARQKGTLANIPAAVESTPASAPAETMVKPSKLFPMQNSSPNNYLLSDNLREIGERAKHQHEESVKAEQNRYIERMRWVNEKKQEQEKEKYDERIRWVSEAMAKQEEANKQEITNTSNQIDDLYTQLEIQSAALQAGDISKDTFDEMNLQGNINDLIGDKLALEKRGREMADRRWKFNNSQVGTERQQYLLNYDVAQGGTQLGNLKGKQTDLQAQIASLDEQLAGYNNLGMTAEAQAVLEERKRLSDQLDFYEQQVTKIRGENTQAERIQVGHDYLALTMEPDFDFYAVRGSAVRNPSYGDVSPKWGDKEKYIGNIVTFSHENQDAIIADEIEFGSAIGSSLYLYMTENEVGIYNYLLAKEGKESAQDYLDYLTETLNARKGYGEGKRIRSIEDNTARTLMTGMYGLGAGVDQFASGIKQRFSGKKLPTSSTQYGSQYIRDNLANVGPEILGNSVGQVLYDGTVVTGNYLPSVLVGSVLGPAAGSVSMGLSASGNAYGQALAQGYSKHQANQYSLAIGASEAVLQYLLGGIGKLSKGATGKLASLIGKIDNSLLKLAVNGTFNIIKEGGEEYLQALLEPVYRNIIFGEENKIEPLSEDKIYQALLGAITAAGMNGATNASLNVIELLTLEGRQAAGLKKANSLPFMDSFDADGNTKKTASVMDDGESFAEPISIEDTEVQRYQKLKDRKVLVIPYDKEKLQRIEEEDYAKLQETACSEIYKILRNLGEEYGLYKEYLNLDIQTEFVFSRNRMDESTQKQKTDFQNYAKVLTVFDQVVENAICIKKEPDRYALPNNNTDHVSTFVSAVDIRDGEKKKPQILPVLIAAKTFTDGTNSVMHMVISLPQIKGSSIIGHNLTANAVQPYPVGALECSLSDLFANVNPYGWNKGMDIPDGRFLKYVPDGFLDEMQKLAKEYALIEQKQYDRRKTIDKYLKMKRKSPGDEAVLQQLTTEKETEEANENARLEEIISRFRELAQTDGLAEKWMESFAREFDGDISSQNVYQTIDAENTLTDLLENGNMPSYNKNAAFYGEPIRNGVGARSITDYKVINPKTGAEIEFVEGSRPVYPSDHLLAGKGSKKPIQKIDQLLDDYGGEPSEWKHEKAFFRAYDDYGEECNVELHWFEASDGVKYELYAKVRNGEVYFYD